MKQMEAQHNIQDEIAGRFAVLVRESSQAEIARKTDTPTTTISRYVAGAKIPASFCAKLVEKLGVNPAWLLVGEGEPRISEVTEHTASMAGNMLELIQAMNVVVGMRLGELVGKDHLKVLRQLNDTLNRYDDLKNQLNTQSKQVMEELLGKLRLALSKSQGKLAERYLEACKQMARLRDDTATAIELATLEGLYQTTFVSPSNALEHFKRAFVTRLASSAQVDEDYCKRVTDYASALAYVSRYDEAFRAATSALALIEGKAEFARWEAYLNVLAGTFELDLGRLRHAQTRINKYFPLLHENDKQQAQFGSSFLELYSGRWPVSWSMCPEQLSLSISIPSLRVARLNDDPEVMRSAYQRFVGSKLGQLPPSHGVGQSTRLLLEALDGRDVESDFREHCEEHERRHWKGEQGEKISSTLSAISLATFYRYSGKITQAATYALRSAELLLDFPVGVTLPVFIRAYHYTTVLKLSQTSHKLPQEMTDQAAAFFDEKIEAGYLCFKSIAI